MPIDRRRFLFSVVAGTVLPCFARAAEPLLPAARHPRVVIVGGGWGGLAAAHALRQQAPQIEVALVERSPRFFSCPLSNRWLAGLIDGRLLEHDYRRAADAYGYRFVQTEVTAIDRDTRRVATRDGVIDYDWLVLATGIRYDYRTWFGDESGPAEEAERRYGCAFRASEIAALKTRLDAFSGGDLVMNLPKLPYRCPPAPYERACAIAALMKAKKLKGKLILIDPNPMMQAFNRVFSGQYRDQITYLPQAGIRSVDPFAKKIVTDFDEIRFDDAILMPPQQAGELAWQAGLIGTDERGTPTGWAAQEPLTLQARADERIFLVGDMIDRASQLFGHYPKTGHMAAAQGRIAAQQIAARAAGREADHPLPESTCFVLAGTEPMEMVRIETSYRVRGDGLIQQAVRQHYDAQPRDEDIVWAKGMFADLLAAKF